ncbi:MAG: glycosyltransferase [Pseudomonas sp.]
MRFLVYSEVNAANIATSLGKPEYSYYFVLREFLPVLQQLGEVLVVEFPETEVDAHYQRACEAGEDCVFLSFSPPHKTTLGLRCPTIPVFAWEFDSIPTEVWYDEPEQDWRHGLRLCGRAIVHSQLTVDAVRAAMGEDFPVISIPAPVWDRFAAFRALASRAGEPVAVSIQKGVLMDTLGLSLEPYRPAPDALERFLAASQGESPETSEELPTPVLQQAPTESRSLRASVGQVARISLRYLVEWYRLVWRDVLRVAISGVAPATGGYSTPEEPAPVIEIDHWSPAAHDLCLEGVVFTAVFNPYDGRKNWMDMLTAFCAAFREVEDAVLVFKLTHQEYRSAMESMLMCLGRLPPFRCRIILLHGYLDEADYHALLGATAYVVNASHGEGQCLPLMEYLSCGKPAIAPRNSAMLDYMDEQVGFVVNSWLDGTAWPHDPRLAYRTCRHQLDWSSLQAAYAEAYRCFHEDPQRYQQLSANASERMRLHCSQAVAGERIKRILAMETSTHANPA